MFIMIMTVVKILKYSLKISILQLYYKEGLHTLKWFIYRCRAMKFALFVYMGIVLDGVGVVGWCRKSFLTSKYFITGII